MASQRGFTLLELLVSTAVAAVLVVAATALCRELLLEARMTAGVNALVHSIHQARQAAIVTLRDAAVCRSSDGMRCAGTGDWSSGWLVFVNIDRDEPPAVDAGEPVLAATGPLPLRAVTSNRGAYVLHPFALRATNGTAVFCDERGPRAARAVIVSYTGRPRVSRTTANGGPLSCPG